MSHQVFICHSSRDKEVAAAICDRIEEAGVRCWIAPRDALPGQRYAESIADAIDASRLMLVVLSENANNSEHVISEINLAVDKRVSILPVRVDGVALSRSLDYYLGSKHRFDASRPLLKALLDSLAGHVQRLLAGETTAIPKPAAQHDPEQPVAPEQTVDLEDLQIPPEQVADRDEEMKERLSWDVQVSRKKPACLVLLVDQSFSMNYKIAGRDTQKKDAVADVVNRVLYNAVLTSTKDEGVRHYFDVGILGYGVGEGVKSTFDGDLVSIGWVADHPTGWVQKKWEVDDGEGGTTQREQPMPVWLEPFGKGQTLMKSAFERALVVVRRWTDEHQDSFPPIVLNITDGGWTRDENPAPVVRELQEQATNVGNALVFNCHLSEKEGQTVMFPSVADAQEFDGRTLQLYDMSSPLPEPMLEQAILMGYNVEPGARGYVRNADFTSLINFMDIGTRAIGIVEV